jgi:hypothetical protein
MTILNDIHRCCARGFCGNQTIFQCPSSSFCDPSFHVAWTSFWGIVYWGQLYHTLVVGLLRGGGGESVIEQL